MKKNKDAFGIIDETFATKERRQFTGNICLALSLALFISSVQLYMYKDEEDDQNE